MSDSQLFQPIQVGDMVLQHRVVLAPLTRFRASITHTPYPVVTEYYSQRASTPGSLLITEATFIAAQAGGFDNVPGIWSEEQITEWKNITDAVHCKGSFIYLQLWALGRAADPKVLEQESLPVVSASDVPLKSSGIVPRPFTVDEIKQYVRLYVTAATNAVHKAGFDGVEVHAANGFLLDQFIQNVSNKRTDMYGGSIVNRARFPLEVLDAVTKTIGQRKTGFRLSPWSDFQDMGEADPVPTFSHIVTRLRNEYPDLAYLHVVEPRIAGIDDSNKAPALNQASNDFLRDIWSPRPFIAAGGYNRAGAIETAKAHKNNLIAFGRHFIPNPDLPRRLKEDIPLRVYDRATFFLPGEKSGRYYTDFAFAQ